MNFSKELVRGSLPPIILRLLDERPMYGYEIVKLVNSRSNGLLEWKEGTLYPALHRLESDGLIRGEWRPGSTSAGATAARPRKYYCITRRGRTTLKERASEWSHFTSAVGMILS